MPAQAAEREKWTCLYSRERIILSHPVAPDAGLNALMAKDTKGVKIKGEAQLVLVVSRFTGNGIKFIDGSYPTDSYFRDNGFFMLNPAGGEIGTDKLLISQAMPDGRIGPGMFVRPRPVTPELGRNLGPSFPHIANLPQPQVQLVVKVADVFNTIRFYLRVPTTTLAKAFAAGHAKSIKATDSTMRPC